MHLHPPEARTLVDRRTGVTVRQVTSHPSIHHHPFYYLPTYDDAMARLFFVSHRTGRPEIWCEIRATGSHKERIWVINRDGTGNRLVYDRKPLATPGQYEWIVHETWSPARGTGILPVPRREIITANWPRGCIGIDIDTGAVRKVCSFNAWHPSINRQGTLMCADTVYPDIGLQLFSPLDGVGVPTPLCYPEASCEGAHWDTDHCPYDDEDYQQGQWKVYAPQHTHPHPSFSPDGCLVVFTSDCSGHAQVYEAASIACSLRHPEPG